MNATGISYCTHSWSPALGCTPCSPACSHCWAKELWNKRHAAFIAGKQVPPQYAKPFSTIQFHESRLKEPLSLRKPAIIATCFNGDLFHQDVKSEWIDRVFMAMTSAQNQTFLVLTKRPRWVATYLNRHDDPGPYILSEAAKRYCTRYVLAGLLKWPLPNVYLGWSAWDQASFDAGWKELAPLAAQGWKTWCSMEPLLGPVRINAPCFRGCSPGTDRDACAENSGLIIKSCQCECHSAFLSFLALGCESGKGARPMHVEWARTVKDQCVEAGVPFHFKQAMVNGKLVHLPELDGKVWDAKPEVR